MAEFVTRERVQWVDFNPDAGGVYPYLRIGGAIVAQCWDSGLRDADRILDTAHALADQEPSLPPAEDGVAGPRHFLLYGVNESLRTGRTRGVVA